MTNNSNEKAKDFAALMDTAQGGAVRAIKNDLQKLLAIAEGRAVTLPRRNIQKLPLHDVTKELLLENM